MSHPTISMLDQEELFQLACNASAADDSASAIGYLKEAVSRVDATARAHYLLGAEYAQVRLYQRAVEEMQSALALDPALSIARLQLGLLWLGNGDPERATTVLEPLAGLPEGDALRQFGAGLCFLIRDQIDDAVALIEQGIALNHDNPPLNVDMRQILDELARVRDGEARAAVTPDEDAHHVLLSAYTGNTSH